MHLKINAAGIKNQHVSIMRIRIFVIFTLIAQGFGEYFQ